MKILKGLLKIIVFLGVAILVWYFGSIAYQKLTFGDIPSKINREEVQAANLGENNKIKPAVDNELLFLLAGTDQNSGDSNGHTRSDTMMLIKIDFKDGNVDILSLPRDTRVPVNGKKDKLNHAASYGGIELTMKTIRDWLDIDLDYYMRVNFESTVQLVDLIGGVEIDVPEVVANGINNNPGVHNGVKIKAGLQRLDGKQALEFVRFRKGYATGDYGRVEAQQKFMTALIKELFKPKNILNFPNFIDLAIKDTDTNISKLYLLSKISSAAKFDSDNIDRHIIPGDGEYIDNVSYFVYNRKKTIELRNELYNEYRLNGVNYLENN